MLAAKAGESIVVFYDSLHSLQILPILAIGNTTESPDPILLLSWDCEKPSCPPYNAKNVVPHLPIPPTPQMLWMSVNDLITADCRIVSLSTLNDVTNKANLQFTLPEPAGEYVNVDGDAEIGESDDSPKPSGDSTPPPDDNTGIGSGTDPASQLHRRPVNLPPTLLHVDVAR